MADKKPGLLAYRRVPVGNIYDIFMDEWVII
jgi:hypothetical protein